MTKHRVLDQDALIGEIIDHPQLGAIRGHARRGTTPNWPVSSRRIDEILKANQTTSDDDGEVIHESDIL